MNQQKENRYVAVTRQVDSVRRIYSQIGEPLPADIIIDLHHHLGAALELVGQASPAKRQKHNSSKRKIM